MKQLSCVHCHNNTKQLNLLYFPNMFFGCHLFNANLLRLGLFLTPQHLCIPVLVSLYQPQSTRLPL